MNEIIKSKLNDVEFVKRFADKGKYGVIALSAYFIYKLADKAIDNDYNLSIDIKNLKFEFSK